MHYIPIMATEKQLPQQAPKETRSLDTQSMSSSLGDKLNCPNPRILVCVQKSILEPSSTL